MHKDYQYEADNGAITITKYTGAQETVTIPEEIDGLPVRVIGEEAFADNAGELTSVVVPESVREIKDGAFKFCLGLQELIFSEGLQVLGTDVVLVTPISELNIPSTVREIHNPHELGGLKLNISPDNPYYYSDGYGLYEKHEQGDTILAVDLRGECTSYRIPEGTRVIGQGAFCGQEAIEEVWCPNSLRVIEEEAFESCRKLKTAHFNEGLEAIGDNAFSYCALEGILYLPASLKEIGKCVFTNTFNWDVYQDRLERIAVSETNRHFYGDRDGFYRKREDGSLELLRYFGKDNMWRVPDSVGAIGPQAFRRAAIKEIILPASVKELGEKIFTENQNILSLVVEQDQTKVYIPRIPVYRREEVTNLLHSGETGYRYDYQEYDNLWSTYLYVQDQAGMASFRLKYPRELSPEKEKFYRDWLAAHLKEVVEDIAAREDRELLAELSEISFFDDGTIDAAIDILNLKGKTELLGFLMEYKQKNLEVEEFDFSL